MSSFLIRGNNPPVPLAKAQEALALAEKELAAVLADLWACGDCGNRYHSSVAACPNDVLDHAEVKVRAAQQSVRRRR